MAAEERASRLAGLSGGSVSECLLLCLVCPASLVLRRSLGRAGVPAGGPAGFCADTAALALPALAVCARGARSACSRSANAVAQAVLAPQRCVQLLATLLLLAAGAAASAARRPAGPPARAERVTAVAEVPFIAAYRSSVLLGTAAAILAVDFRLFPLRLAKTHAGGTSLMDLGSGSFAFAGGACRAGARNARRRCPPACRLA